MPTWYHQTFYRSDLVSPDKGIRQYNVSQKITAGSYLL